MYELYSDDINVTESLEQIAEQVRESEMPSEGRLIVADFGQAKAVALGRSAIEARNIEPGHGNRICVIEWDYAADFAGVFHFTLKFHENEVQTPFTLRPAGVHAISPDQATAPTKLGDRLGTVLTPLVEEYDAIFTFSEVSAASMANGGHFTDFEFEYAIDGIDI